MGAVKTTASNGTMRMDQQSLQLRVRWNSSWSAAAPGLKRSRCVVYRTWLRTVSLLQISSDMHFWAQIALSIQRADSFLDVFSRCCKS